MASAGDQAHDGRRQADAGTASDRVNLQKHPVGISPATTHEPMVKSRPAQPEQQANAIGMAANTATVTATGTPTSGLTSAPRPINEKQRIAADSDEGQLAHRDQASIAGQKKPQAGERNVGKQFTEQAQCLPVTPEGGGDANDEHQGKQDEPEAARSDPCATPGKPDVRALRPR